MSCETRTDSAGREVSACTLTPGGGAVVHAWHSNLAPFPPHSLCGRPRLSLSVRPSARRPGYHIIAGSEVNGSGRCFILARSPSSAAVLHGWMARPLLPARSGALDGLSAPPSSAFRATNYHTFGSDSVASAHCGDTPKMRGAPRHIPFTGAITKAASRFIAPSAVSPVRRGHLSLRLSGYRSLIYYRNIINGLRN